MNATLKPSARRCIPSDIVCDEAGTPDARGWEGSVAELGSDYNAVLSHAQNKTIRIIERAGRIEIRGRDRVGVLGLPSGRRILLRTKISGIVLLDWLVYLQEFPDLQLWATGGNIQQSDSWQSVLARLFLRELEIVTRCHLRKGFIQQTVDSPRVRGRILAGRLSQKPWRLPSIPQVVRSRSLNTSANQMLAAALDQVMLCQAELGADESHLFRQLRNDWSTISRENIDRQTIIQTSLSAPPDGYRSALQLARLLLTGATVDYINGYGGHTFTLSLARIWESAITRMCQDLSPQTGWKVVSRSQSVRPWDDALRANDPYRSMIADTLLQRENERWVLDAKYKRSFGFEDRNDRFQMCAYAFGFGAGRATLVYPFTSKNGDAHRTLLSATYGNQPLTIDAIALPMADGPENCRTKLLASIQGHGISI